MAQYASTTINSAAPTVDLFTWASSQFADNGWTLVESLTPIYGGSGTMTGAATTSATATVLTRSGGSGWTTSQLIGYTILFTSGTGAGTSAVITANTSVTLTVAAWPVQPDNTSVFDIVSLADIYLSPAASNSINHDFYVAVVRAGSGIGGSPHGVSFRIFEEWDASTKKMRKFAPSGSGTAFTPDTDHSITDAVGLTVAGSAMSALLAQSSVATTYVSDVTVDRAMFGCSTWATAFPVYVGVFDSLLPASMDPVPLCHYRFGGSANEASSVSYGACTREPGATVAGSGNYNVQGFTLSSTRSVSVLASAYAVSDYGTGNYASSIALGGNLYRGHTAARIMIFSSRAAPASGGSLRGVLQGALTTHIGAAIGDTLTVTTDAGGTQTYVMVQLWASTMMTVWIRTS